MPVQSWSYQVIQSWNWLKTPIEILWKLLENSYVSSITFKAYNCRHFIQNLVNFGPGTKLQCYKTLFHPIVEYKSSVWDSKGKKQL